MNHAHLLILLLLLLALQLPQQVLYRIVARIQGIHPGDIRWPHGKIPRQHRRTQRWRHARHRQTHTRQVRGVLETRQVARQCRRHRRVHATGLQHAWQAGRRAGQVVVQRLQVAHLLDERLDRVHRWDRVRWFGGNGVAR